MNRITRLRPRTRTHRGIPMFWRSKRNTNDRIMKLGPDENDWLSIDSCFNNIFVLGQVGSGKTTGPLAHLALGLLGHPSKPGALVLCQKPTEGRLWLSYAKKAGRLNDVIHVTPNGPHKLDIIDYEINTEGGGFEAAAE